MHKFITLSVVFGLTCSGLYAAMSGTLEFSPEKPKVSSTIEITYKSGDLFKNSTAQLYAFVYVFNESQLYPTALSTALTKSKNKYTGSISGLPSDAVFALVNISDGRITDWNSDHMWEFVIHDGSKPARGAALRYALSYLGSAVSNIKRPMDYEKAKTFLRQEIQNYADNFQAKITLADMMHVSTEIDKSEYTKRIENLVTLGFDKNKENEVRSVSRALKSIGRPADGDVIEQAFVSANPLSDLAEENERIRCYQSKTREEFETNIQAYTTRFKSFPVFSTRMFTDLLSSYIQQGNGDQAMRVVRSYPVPPGVNSNPPPAILNMLAVSLLQQDSLLVLSRQYAERAMRSAENQDASMRPRFMTKEEYDFSNREIRGVSYDTYGYILRRLNKLDEAVEAYKQSEEILGDAVTGDMMEHLAEALAASGKNEESVKVMRQAIRTAKAIAPTNQRFLALASPDVAKNEEEFKSLKREAHEIHLNNLRVGMMNDDIQTKTFSRKDGKQVSINEFRLTNLEGKSVRLSDLKGKVVVIDFWATWCGPCRTSMPFMQKVYEKYKDNDDVLILMVNSWERTPDTSEAQRLVSRSKIVRDFMTQNKSFSFPMFIDVSDDIVGCLGVTGIPTKFYIDKQGKVQFKEVGFPGADVFVDDASDKIDLLLKQ